MSPTNSTGSLVHEERKPQKFFTVELTSLTYVISQGGMMKTLNIGGQRNMQIDEITAKKRILTNKSGSERKNSTVHKAHNTKKNEGTQLVIRI